MFTNKTATSVLGRKSTLLSLTVDPKINEEVINLEAQLHSKQHDAVSCALAEVNKYAAEHSEHTIETKFTLGSTNYNIICEPNELASITITNQSTHIQELMDAVFSGEFEFEIN